MKVDTGGDDTFQDERPFLFWRTSSTHDALDGEGQVLHPSAKLPQKDGETREEVVRAKSHLPRLGSHGLTLLCACYMWVMNFHCGESSAGQCGRSWWLETKTWVSMNVPISVPTQYRAWDHANPAYIPGSRQGSHSYPQGLWKT